MATTTNKQATVIRTDRGLSIAGTRITLYAIMDYVTAGYPAEHIQHLYNLTDEQISDVLAYIDAHRMEVEAEYQQVLRDTEETRRFWEERNRAVLAQRSPTPDTPERAALRAKLQAWRDQLNQR